MSKITFTQGDIKLGNLSYDEIEMIKDLIKYFNGCKIGHEIDVCLKKFQNDYYFSVPICVSEDGPIYIDQRITETPFVFDDLCMPNDLISIKFLRDKFVSSSFKRSFSPKKEDYTKNYTQIFFTDLSNKLHDCEPHPFEFSASLYEIYPKYESKYEQEFSIFKVPDNVKEERMNISKSFVWYLYTQLKYIELKYTKHMSSKTFASMSAAVDAVTEKLEYYNPDKPPTDEPGKWQKVVHRFRTEWIPIDECAAITPAAAPWNEDAVVVD